MSELHWISVFTAETSLGVIALGLGVRLSQHVRGNWIIRSLAMALGLVGIRILILAF